MPMVLVMKPSLANIIRPIKNDILEFHGSPKEVYIVSGAALVEAEHNMTLKSFHLMVLISYIDNVLFSYSISPSALVERFR